MFGKKKHNRADPEAISAQADAATEQLRAQQPRVNALNGWLEGRYQSNGFGDDFEWTLKPKES